MAHSWWFNLGRCVGHVTRAVRTGRTLPTARRTQTSERLVEHPSLGRLVLRRTVIDEVLRDAPAGVPAQPPVSAQPSAPSDPTATAQAPPAVGPPPA
ncbi:MAG: hypothetical protein C0475_06340 [Planctomyces sp.]|nr:hypothetical protein [Planctomyces sp.]MBA4039553.1 hypothetical protein [Planctomyces sp.]MBA4119675.1 hypothetical protein [Isosphaera sp.]